MARDGGPLDMVEANGALVQRFIEDFWAGGDLSRVGEFLSSEYVEHNLLPGQEPGLEGYKHRYLTLRAAFPDVRVTIEGTHLGPFLGQPASGRLVRMAAINVYRVANGRIVERWGVQDLYGLLRQIADAEAASQ